MLGSTGVAEQRGRGDPALRVAGSPVTSTVWFGGSPARSALLASVEGHRERVVFCTVLLRTSTTVLHHGSTTPTTRLGPRREERVAAAPAASRAPTRHRRCATSARRGHVRRRHQADARQP